MSFVGQGHPWYRGWIRYLLGGALFILLYLYSLGHYTRLLVDRQGRRQSVRNQWL